MEEELTAKELMALSFSKFKEQHQNLSDPDENVYKIGFLDGFTSGLKVILELEFKIKREERPN